MELPSEDIVKIFYKDYIKYFRHPTKENQSKYNIFAQDVYEAYKIITNDNNPYLILAKNDKKLFNKLLNSLKKRTKILLMLDAENIELSIPETLKTVKFSTLFKNMSIDKLAYNGLDTKWLQHHDFFK